MHTKPTFKIFGRVCPEAFHRRSTITDDAAIPHSLVLIGHDTRYGNDEDSNQGVNGMLVHGESGGNAEVSAH